MSVSPAQAVQLFFGEDLHSSPSTRLGSTPNAAQAETDFLANLIGVGTEDFEGLSTGATGPLALSFPGAGTATLNGNGEVKTVDPNGTEGNGRYSISGTNFWQADAANGAFSITFSEAIAAFGFYGIDIGDFGGQLELVLSLANGGTQTVTANNTIGSSGSTDGSVLYLGLLAESAEELFTGISFQMSTGEGDIFAFDDMTIGSLEQVVIPDPPADVPEPSAMVSLLAVGALGLGLRRKKTA
ncbi:MAG: PEP-CTERM sorting domain-containing protein [Cyanobacteria bacterium P01_H01_bin.130]